MPSMTQKLAASVVAADVSGEATSINAGEGTTAVEERGPSGPGQSEEAVATTTSTTTENNEVVEDEAEPIKTTKAATAPKAEKATSSTKKTGDKATLKKTKKKKDAEPTTANKKKVKKRMTTTTTTSRRRKRSRSLPPGVVKARKQQREDDAWIAKLRELKTYLAETSAFESPNVKAVASGAVSESSSDPIARYWARVRTQQRGQRQLLVKTTGGMKAVAKKRKRATRGQAISKTHPKLSKWLKQQRNWYKRRRGGEVTGHGLTAERAALLEAVALDHPHFYLGADDDDENGDDVGRGEKGNNNDGGGDGDGGRGSGGDSGDRGEGEASSSMSTVYDPDKDPSFKPLFKKNASSNLSSLYDARIDAAASHHDASSKLRDAQRKLEEAQRLMDMASSEADDTQRRLDAATTAVRDAELTEPCSWNDMYDRLRKYRDEMGTAHVPCPDKVKSTTDSSLLDLANWTMLQKRRYRLGRLQRDAPHRVKALEDLGFQWQYYEGRWDYHYERMREWVESHGGPGVAKLPSRTAKNASDSEKELSQWLTSQKADYRRSLMNSPSKKSFITPERIKLLQDLGFDLDARPTWENRLDALADHRRRTGHCRPTSDRPLTRWIDGQRAEYKKYLAGEPVPRLDASRRERLDAIGFCWTRCKCESAGGYRGFGKKATSAVATEAEAWEEANHGGGGISEPTRIAATAGASAMGPFVGVGSSFLYGGAVE